MKRIFILAIAVLFVFVANAQQGGRISAFTGATKVSLTNADDSKAAGLQLLPTAAAQYGVEVGYGWRYFGIGFQLARFTNGQRYNYYGQFQKTCLQYVKPSFLLRFNSNPKNDVQFTGFVGGYYAALTNYKDESQLVDPVTKAITYNTIANKTFSLQDTGSIAGTISNGIYYSSDAGAIAGIGLDFRLTQTWHLGISARVDIGVEKLENYDKMQQKYTIGKTAYTYDYEHWRYKPSKFDYQPLYNGVRASSTNMSTGVFVNLTYLLLSREVRDYERYGY